MREVVGQDYPILIKMNCQDFQEGGLSLEDSVQAAALLVREAGLDAIELSGGLLTGGKLSPIRPGIDSFEKEAYFKEELRAFKKAINIPLILVGGIRSFEVAEQLVADGTADYISMSRPFIMEPDLINRWQAGDRRPAECTSDNLCLKLAFKGEEIYSNSENVSRKNRHVNPALFCLCIVIPGYASGPPASCPRTSRSGGRCP